MNAHHKPAPGNAILSERTTMITADTNPWIEIFTTPTCSDCIAIKRWFIGQGIPFVERDLRDPAVAEEARRRTGVRIAPITILGGNVFFGSYSNQISRIEALLDMQKAA